MTADINPPFFYTKNDYIGVNIAENLQKSAENLHKNTVLLYRHSEKLRRETKELAENLRVKTKNYETVKGANNGAELH